MTKKLTSDELKDIREYLHELEDLAQAEPPMFNDIEHDTEPSPEWNAWNKRVLDLCDKYADSIRSVLVKSLPIEEEVALADLLKRMAAVPEQALPPYGYLINSPQLQTITKVLTTGGEPKDSEVTRTEKWNIERDGQSIKYTRTNRRGANGFKIMNPEIFFPGTTREKHKRGTIVTRKLLPFVLQKMTQQGYPRRVSIDISELVDLGAYKTVDSAYNGIRRFFQQMSTAEISWFTESGKHKTESAGIIFYHLERRDGMAYIYVNDRFNMGEFAKQFTLFPRWAYGLKPTAFDLVRYIFYIARQNTRSISENGTFNIGMKAVAENLGLPPVDEVKNRRYRQQIRKPIEDAIEEIEERVAATPEAKGLFSITPYVNDLTSSIDVWLDGYIEVKLGGDYADPFNKIASKQKLLVEQAKKAGERKAKSK